MNDFTFIIPGEPVPKARPRFNSRTGHTYTTSKTAKAEKLIKDAYLAQGGRNLADYEGKVEIAMVFHFPIRKSWTKKKQEELLDSTHTIKPDLDNLEKTVLDALNRLAFKDDSQVCMVRKTKLWKKEARTIVQLTYGEGEE